MPNYNHLNYKNVDQEYHLFGFNSKKRYNFNILDEDNIIFIAGITFQIYNLKTKKFRIFYSRDKGGIGSISIHPNKKFFAVAEKGKFPNIYIYGYPSLEVYRILREGTEKSYSNVKFSNDGNKLASVGSETDFNWCVWDWKNEIQILKTKAFSQEVFKVSFSIFDDNILCTSGLAHIRFWKIAETFTGLKLKGETGKFGQIELSDISGFLIFQNGKVLTGSETGSLLLWDGNLIKTVINISKTELCHIGYIEVIKYYKDFIITAGKDSKIKFWNTEEIDQIEGDDLLNSYLKPKCVIEVNSLNSYIVDIIYNDNHWIIHDGNGKLIKLNINELDKKIDIIIKRINDNKDNQIFYEKELNDLKKKLEEEEDNNEIEEINLKIKSIENLISEFNWDIEILLEEEKILEFNSGKINDLTICKSSHVAATIGEDGFIRLWDFCNRIELNSRKFIGQGTCLDWRNINFNKNDRLLAAGFDTGFIRIIILQEKNIDILEVKKVHSTAIKALKYSPNGNILCVFSELELFLFNVSNENPYNHIPYCYIKLNNTFSYFIFSKFKDNILIGYKNGWIEEIKLIEEKNCDYSETFLREDINIQSKTIMMMESQKPQRDEDDFLFGINENLEPFDIEWDPTTITSLLYFDEDCTEFLVCAEGNFIGYIYKCNFELERPITYFTGPNHIVKIMKYSDDNKLLICGCDNGEIYFYDRYNEFQILTFIKNHDQDLGLIVNCFIYNEKLIISTSHDSTFIVKKIDYKSIFEENKEKSFLEINELEIDDEFYFNKKNLVNPKEDILDVNIYSIQEEKLKAEKDKKKKIAESNKKKLKEQLDLLISDFEDFKAENSNLNNEFKLKNNELIIDPEYKEILENRIEEELEEKRKEVLFEKLYFKKKNLKILNFYYKELEINEKDQQILNNLYLNDNNEELKNIEINKFSIKKIKSDEYLTIFKIKKFNKYTEDKIIEINKIIDIEKNKEEEGLNTYDNNQNDVSFELKKKNREKKNILNLIKQKVKRDQTKELEEKITKEKIKKTKEKRRNMVQELEEKQPKKKDVQKNPEIIEAEKNMGNYKLKNDASYEVSFENRMNVYKQEKLIILLEKFIYTAKKDFNKNIYELKDWKLSLIDKITNYNNKIKDINEKLKIKEELFYPKFDEENENPKNIFNVTQEDIDDLKKIKEESIKNKKKGMFGDMEDNQNSSNEDNKILNTEEKLDDSDKNLSKNIIISKPRRLKKKENNSWFFKKIENLNKDKLKKEKEFLKKNLKDEIEDFDKKFDDLKNDKIILEYEIKMANMKLVILFQELIEFEVLEEQDNNLLKDHIFKKEEIMRLNKEKAEKINEIAKLNGTLKNHEVEIDKAKKQFIEKVGQGDPELSSIYYEIIKKIKNKNNDDMNEDGDDYDEDNDKNNDYNQDLESKVLVLLGSDEVNEIYNKRFELETIILTTKENIKRNKNESDNLDEKITLLQNDLEEVTHKLNEIQLVKLYRISKIKISFFLKLNQIMNLNDNEIKLPNNLNDSILFTNDNYNELCNRINILQKEKIFINNKSKDLKSLKEDLGKEINYLKEAYNEARDELKENYQLKFGRIINLNDIDSLEPSEKLKELEKEYEKEKKNCNRRIEEAEKNMLETKRKLIELKQENTSIINKITDLGIIQLNLDKTLNSKNKQLFKDEKEDKVKNTKIYRKDLLQIVKLLDKEINDLQNEIIFYKNKGGKLSDINKFK